MIVLCLPYPGDEITIIDPYLTSRYDSQQTVVEKPLHAKFFGPNGFDVIWTNPKPGIWIFLYPEQYEI